MFLLVFGFGCLVAMGSSAEITINDPTQPVYRQGFTGKSDFKNTDQGEKAREIPPLVQLLYSKSRQIAMFGDEFFRPGDETAFGRIVSIEKDRVMLEHDGLIEVIKLFDPDAQVNPDEQIGVNG